MTDKLPPNLLALFAPRPPLRYIPHGDKAAGERKTADITGVAQFLPSLKEYKETDHYQPSESWLEMKDRQKLERKAAEERLRKEAPLKFNPHEDPNIRGDAFKTLMVARLSYEANEQDLEREFGRFGPIERIRIITDTHADKKVGKKKKPHRGYAFVVFEREKDMRAALDQCEGIRIKDRRIKVDVERGRTVRDWKPLRLGGGLGGRGYTKAMPSRPMGPGGFGGGFRGGFRGGFEGGRGRGGFRGGFGGGERGGRFRDRGGPNGFGGPPSNAPGGPGGPGGYGGGGRRDHGGGGGGYDSRNGRSYDDRSGGGRHGDPRRSGSNMEPIGRRDERGGGGGGGGYRDRDRDRDFDRPRDDDSRKRGFDGGYDDPRKLRRY